MGQLRELGSVLDRGRTIWALAREFLVLVWRRSREDAINVKASALAYATILGIVPLLAAFGFVGTRMVDRYQDQLLAILMSGLPYGEAAISERLELYMQQAESLQGLGLLAFLLIGLSTLHTIEETINKIWRASERATFRGKLVSFALVLFWTPMLIGGVLSLLVMAQRSVTFRILLEESFLVRILPMAVTALGLTMVYWQVPRVAVRFRWAMAGGTLVAVCLELLHRPFAYYVDNVNQLSLVYGSFAIILLFMISIQIAWWAVLIGAEVAYVGQHFETLQQGRRVDDRVRGPWVGLAALMVLARSLRDGRPLMPATDIAAALGLPPAVLEESLGPLLRRGLVISTDADGLALARDPHELSVEEILGSHDGPVDELFASIETPEWVRLEALRESLRDLRSPLLRRLTLVELLEDPPRPQGVEDGSGSSVPA